MAAQPHRSFGDAVLSAKTGPRPVYIYTCYLYYLYPHQSNHKGNRHKRDGGHDEVLGQATGTAFFSAAALCMISEKEICIKQ